MKTKQATAKHVFRAGFRGPRTLNPDAVAKELAKLASKSDGPLTPQSVVDAAEPATSPLHDAFEWDDTIAARQHRIAQARDLIRSVIVIHPDRTPTPVWVHVVAAPEASRNGDDSDREGGGYYPAIKVAKRPEMFLRAVGELRGTLVSATRSVLTLLRLAPSSVEAERVAALESAIREVLRASDRLDSQD